MNRRGVTLIEMMATLIILVVVLDLGVTATSGLERATRADGQAPVLVDLACEALRRDLAHGARIDGADLIAGKARWRVRAGTLTRDGAPRCRVGSCAWSIDGRAVVVRLTAPGMTAREVRAWR